MRSLSKSKLLAFRQCPKQLWLEIHKPDEREDSVHTSATFKIGHDVGDIARRLYDPKNKGETIDAQIEGYEAALARSTRLFGTAQPLFEAGFSAKGAIAFADVMLPVNKRSQIDWRMVEVKSSSKVKDYHRDDVAIQTYIAKAAGVPISSVSVAHVDTSWTYPGSDDYNGLLVEEDLTDEALGRAAEVRSWLSEAHAVADKNKEPRRTTGKHCNTPFECGFAKYCSSKERQPKISASILPRISPKLSGYLEEHKILELEDVPDDRLNPTQLRVKRHTLQGKPFFDAKSAAAELAGHKLPALFIDFETISFAVPFWKGTRPYQQIPFQFSVHRLESSGALTHREFLSLDGSDPSKPFATALIDACSKPGPVFVYNASFEKARINELAERFSTLRKPLLAITGRIVDLLPIAQSYFYHPSQEGSLSLKAVLPAAVPSLDYSKLEGVQDGGLAMSAFIEAIHPKTEASRKQTIARQLSEYCKLDTYALVRLWQLFAGRKDLKL